MHVFDRGFITSGLFFIWVHQPFVRATIKYLKARDLQYCDQIAWPLATPCGQYSALQWADAPPGGELDFLAVHHATCLIFKRVGAPRLELRHQRSADVIHDFLKPRVAIAPGWRGLLREVMMSHQPGADPHFPAAQPGAYPHLLAAGTGAAQPGAYPHLLAAGTGAQPGAYPHLLAAGTEAQPGAYPHLLAAGTGAAQPGAGPAAGHGTPVVNDCHPSPDQHDLDMATGTGGEEQTSPALEWPQGIHEVIETMLPVAAREGRLLEVWGSPWEALTRAPRPGWTVLVEAEW
ncbi:hypothetical protein PAPYR_12407 [Paratrimastix pyriformis]|uniref:Uncharacterized protein n=1 Tax=Paratrimastix pyriformis TaxID=342808 RepID=A0ABQ8U783_9EUKA|nr:hypothetical protein PAPYR_12407 [Paratrimastix pyriformis]